MREGSHRTCGNAGKRLRQSCSERIAEVRCPHRQPCGAPLAKRVVSAGMQSVAHKVELCMKCSVRPGGNACARRPKKSAGATAALPFAKLQSPLTKLRCARCGRCVLAGMGERTDREVLAPREQWARGMRSCQRML